MSKEFLVIQHRLRNTRNLIELARPKISSFESTEGCIGSVYNRMDNKFWPYEIIFDEIENRVAMIIGNWAGNIR
jgi:hypothetical protein